MRQKERMLPNFFDYFTHQFVHKNLLFVICCGKWARLHIQSILFFSIHQKFSVTMSCFRISISFACMYFLFSAHSNRQIRTFALNERRTVRPNRWRAREHSDKIHNFHKCQPLCKAKPWKYFFLPFVSLIWTR